MPPCLLLLGIALQALIRGMSFLNNGGRLDEGRPPPPQLPPRAGPLEVTRLASEAASYTGLGGVTAYMNPTQDTMRMLGPSYPAGFGAQRESHGPGIAQLAPRIEPQQMAPLGFQQNHPSALYPSSDLVSPPLLGQKELSTPSSVSMDDVGGDGAGCPSVTSRHLEAHVILASPMDQSLDHELISHSAPTPKNSEVTAEDRSTAIHTLLLNCFCDYRERDLRIICADWGKGHLYESSVKVINKDPLLKQANASRKKGGTHHRHLAIRRLKELLPAEAD